MNILGNTNSKKQTLVTISIVAVILLLLNIIGTQWHAKVDLTEEHRFTISAPTKNLLKAIKEPVTLNILLKDGVPSNFTKLRNSTIDILNSFKEISGNKITYTITNPTEGKTGDELLKVYESLAKKRANPVKLNAQLDSKQKTEEQIIFPYVLVNSNGRETTIPLIENHTGMGAYGKLNYSESMLEYKLASAIQMLNTPAKIDIAYLIGNGQPLGTSTADMLLTLANTYKIDTLNINALREISPVYKAAIICRPSVAFTEQQKFVIDQYVMAGGHVMWLIDACNIAMDTLSKSPNYSVTNFDLNLDDLFFKYGFRCNNNLVEDLSANPIPVTVGMQDNKPQFDLLKWIYFPVFSPISKHPIVNNMDAIASKFAGTIDTISNPNITSTVLLNTSPQSRVLGTPLTVSLNSLKFEPKVALFNKQFLPTAILQEGNFKSLYAGRVTQDMLAVYEDSLKLKFRTATSKPNKMIVVSDADIVLNDFSETKGISDMGFYKFTKENFANKTFLLNCLEFLTNENALLEARNKDLRLRMLDPEKVSKNRAMWQVINVALPIALTIFIGGLYWFFRKKRYEQKK
jgi:ABC-2 type transport system permease protein